MFLVFSIAGVLWTGLSQHFYGACKKVTVFLLLKIRRKINFNSASPIFGGTCSRTEAPNNWRAWQRARVSNKTRPQRCSVKRKALRIGLLADCDEELKRLPKLEV